MVNIHLNLKRIHLNNLYILLHYLHNPYNQHHISNIPLRHYFNHNNAIYMDINYLLKLYYQNHYNLYSVFMITYMLNMEVYINHKLYHLIDIHQHKFYNQDQLYMSSKVIHIIHMFYQFQQLINIFHLNKMSIQCLMDLYIYNKLNHNSSMSMFHPNKKKDYILHKQMLLMVMYISYKVMYILNKFQLLMKYYLNNNLMDMLNNWQLQYHMYHNQHHKLVNKNSHFNLKNFLLDMSSNEYHIFNMLNNLHHKQKHTYCHSIFNTLNNY